VAIQELPKELEEEKIKEDQLRKMEEPQPRESEEAQLRKIEEAKEILVNEEGDSSVPDKEELLKRVFTLKPIEVPEVISKEQVKFTIRRNFQMRKTTTL